MTRSWALLACLVLYACGDGSGDGSGDGGGDGGSPTVDGGTADGGSTDGVGTTSTSGLPLSSDCSNVFPIDNPGTVWTYRYDGVDDVGTDIVTALGQDDYRGEAAWSVEVVTATSQAATPENTHDQTDRSWYRCDATGVWLLGWTSDVRTVDSGSTYEWDTVYHYPRPGLLLPADVAEGDSWSFDFEIEYQSGDGYSDIVDWQVEGTETASVEAGDFSCLRITSSSGEDFCSATGVGRVLTVATALSSVVVGD